MAILSELYKRKDPEVDGVNRSVWLLAVSGGIDSMVLLHAMLAEGWQVEVAHVNFGLRGKESDDDAMFVQKQCDLKGVVCHISRPDTVKYASEKRVSIQMAARDLRYMWFEDLLESGRFAGLMTAHHATDHAETMLINLLRGSGLEGMKGISLNRGKIHRPLLHTGKEEIEQYAFEHKVAYREDSSNHTDKYIRNKIRHHVLPVFKEINPSFEQNFLKTSGILSDAARVIFAQAEALRDACADLSEKDVIKLIINEIKSFPQYDVVLYYLLNSYGVNADIMSGILADLDRGPGNIFITRSHKITHDRDHLVISLLNEEDQGFEFELTGPGHFDTGIGQFKVEKLMRDQVRMTDSKWVALLDAETCEFPIKVRNWMVGDSFQPLGMTGTKLLSDFFTDEKIDSTRRNKIPILISEGVIIWVAGMRISHIHKISGKTQTVFRITWTPPQV